MLCRLLDFYKKYIIFATLYFKCYVQKNILISISSVECGMEYAFIRSICSCK